MAKPHWLSLLLLAATLPAQPYDPRLFAELRWRMIGPHRGGRTVAAVGVPGRPATLYIGVNNGGVWRSTDYGRTWTPIFDAQPTGSIGAIAIAPSSPNVLYVGTGEGLQRPDLSTGDGVYRSADAGKTWTNVGLRDGQQIPALAVDPRDENRVYAAVLGHPYGPNAERGVYRTTDGGRSWKKVLGPGPDVGAFEVVLAPDDPATVYAVLWAGRQAPWEIGSSWEIAGAGLFKSTDGGDHWNHVEGGLPQSGDAAGKVPLGRIGIAIAPSDPRRVYAIVDAKEQGGLWRSDDAAATWRRVAADPRLWGRGSDFAEVKVDPKDADTVYVANVSSWKSTDGGKTFTGFRGAPGGDDPHRFWIDPTDPKTILLAGDQGAIVTQNGGASWSSWYNQPTAQLYHVATDNAFPYRVYGGQQESGSVGISSRGDDGQITFREWHPVGVEEYGYVAPDPLDPDVVYGGKLTRWNRRTGQVVHVEPKPLKDDSYRVVRTQPVLFSPLDPRALYFASNVLWKTRDGGDSWEQLSPDLTRESYPTPANLGTFAACDPEKGKHRGVIYTVAPSPLAAGLIWVGTDDGLVHVTADEGKRWTDVTPKQLVPWAKVSMLEASHFDRDTAYAAINTFRLDDLDPHVYRTRDGGKTWEHATGGIPPGGVVNAVREDPKRKGLLYAAAERAVYVSFDAGDHWQSLRLNMPATSVRDLVVKGDDLVVGTHGRSFWILDDVTPLRQLDATVAAAEAFLFEPQVALRVRWNTNTDTPLPQEEPAGQNPPDGAILDYWLAKDAPGVVALEIRDAKGELVRCYASDDQAPEPVAGRNIPDYWIRPWRALPASAGMHRVTWDLRYPAPRGLPQRYPIAAIAGDTPRTPLGPWVLPGRYTVRLEAGGKTYERTLEVRLDPRVKVPPEGLVRAHELARMVAAVLDELAPAAERVRLVRQEIAVRKAEGAAADLFTEFEVALRGLEARPELAPDRLHRDLATLYDKLESSDAPPTSQIETAIRTKAADAAWEVLGGLKALADRELKLLNSRLSAAGIRPIRR